MLYSVSPVLLVRDVTAAAHYWRDALGYRVGQFYGDPPAFVIVARDRMHIMLKQAADPAHVVPHNATTPGIWDAYFYTDDVDALFTELKDRGAIIDYELCDQPYGCREFGIRTPDGHDIAFGQEIKP